MTKEKRMMVDDDHLAKFEPKIDWEEFDKKLSLKIKNVFHNMFRCSGYDEKQFNEKIEYIKKFITDNFIPKYNGVSDWKTEGKRRGYWAYFLEEEKLLNKQNFISKSELEKIDESIIFFAFRYALGRRTYAVGMVADYIIKNKEIFDSQTKKMIVNEIDQAIKSGNFGMDCDKEDWLRVKKEIKARIKKLTKQKIK